MDRYIIKPRVPCDLEIEINKSGKWVKGSNADKLEAENARLRERIKITEGILDDIIKTMDEYYNYTEKKIDLGECDK
jgi:hypothetical protein